MKRHEYKCSRGDYKMGEERERQTLVTNAKFQIVFSHNILIRFTTTSISVRIGQFLSEQSITQLVCVISALVLSERRQILFHKIFNEAYQCHNDSIPIVLTLF